MISASAAAAVGGKVAQIYIPTPEARSSSIKYDDLYPRHFSAPQTYIRFSSTVEDCIGPPYCMDEDDSIFLSKLNQKGKDGEAKCSEDLFEEVMSFFEETAATRQPFAAVDNPPVLSFEEIESAYDDTISLQARKWAKEIYEHWADRRAQRGNRSLMPDLRFETGQDTDDADPYVCFRRREVRQARKTRGRDAQIAEKIKKLRRELEEARQLVHSVKRREIMYKERLEVERKIFEQRSELKRVKIEQGIKGDKGDDEELLVNQRVSWPLSNMTGNILTLHSPLRRSRRMHLSVRPHFVSAPLEQRVALRRTILRISRISRRRRQLPSRNPSKRRSPSIGNGTKASSTTPGVPSPLLWSHATPCLGFFLYCRSICFPLLQPPFIRNLPLMT